MQECNKVLKKYKGSRYLVYHRQLLFTKIIGAHLSRENGWSSRGDSKLLLNFGRQELQYFPQHFLLGVQHALEMLNPFITAVMMCLPPAFTVHGFHPGVSHRMSSQPPGMLRRPNRSRQHVIVSVCLERPSPFFIPKCFLLWKYWIQLIGKQFRGD